MDLKQYGETIIKTIKDNWTIIVCWDFGSGPSYLEHSSVWNTEKGEFSNIEVESHVVIASLKSNLSISIAWGFTSNPDFKEPWANQFPDPSASSSFVDFFYNGVVVFRDIYVSIDGGRCMLPLPEIEFDTETNEVTKYIVPRDKYRFFKTLDTFEKVSDFDRYFKDSGFEIIDEPWMI